MRHTMELNVTVPTQSAIDALERNVDKYAKILDEARAAWTKQALGALDKRIKNVKAGQVAELRFNLPCPEDYSQEYVDKIQMLQLHLKAGHENIELSARQYRAFFDNRWDWADSFISNALMYTDSAKSF